MGDDVDVPVLPVFPHFLERDGAPRVDGIPQRIRAGEGEHRGDVFERQIRGVGHAGRGFYVPLPDISGQRDTGNPAEPAEDRRVVEPRAAITLSLRMKRTSSLRSVGSATASSRGLIVLDMVLVYRAPWFAAAAKRRAKHCVDSLRYAL